MKNLGLIFIFLFITIGMYAQSVPEPDSRAYTRYSAERIQRYLENAPQRIELMNFELEEGYDIIILDDEKLENLPVLYYWNNDTKTKGEIVNSLPVEDFNLYLYNFERELYKDTYYRIGNTNQVLVIYSNHKLVDKFNESR